MLLLCLVCLFFLRSLRKFADSREKSMLTSRQHLRVMICSIKRIKNLHAGVFSQISVSGFGQVIKPLCALASLSVKSVIMVSTSRAIMILKSQVYNTLRTAPGMK